MRPIYKIRLISRGHQDFWNVKRADRQLAALSTALNGHLSKEHLKVFFNNFYAEQQRCFFLKL